MSDYIIKVENLGKKYSIQHQGERERYVALRDVIASKAAAPLRWLRARSAKGKEQSAERQEQSASLNGNGSSPIPLTASQSGSDSSPLPFSPSHSGPGSSPLPLSALPTQEDFWALRGVNFEVKPGEVVGIIGRNGAGKSTLLKILSRITEPTEGRVRIRGRVASLLEVGTGFHPELTGRENIYVNGAILGMTRKEISAKFDEIVAFAEVEKFLDTPVKRYSSGMYVRLAFAVAAHLEPEILVVDEVLAVGDLAFQNKCLDKMRQISGVGRTVLFVSHNLQAIRNLCQRCLLISDGELVMDGDPGQVITNYYKNLRSLEIGVETSLSDSQVRRGSGQVRFSNVRLTKRENRESRFEFEIGETIQFDIRYRVFDALEGLYLLIYLKSMSYKEWVTGARFSLYDDHVSGGRHGRVVVEFPNNNLRPGDYPLYFRLEDQNGRPYDVIDGLSAPLAITTDKTLDEIGFDASQSTGFFSIDAKMVGHEGASDVFNADESVMNYCT